MLASQSGGNTTRWTPDGTVYAAVSPVMARGAASAARSAVSVRRRIGTLTGPTLRSPHRKPTALLCHVVFT